MYKPIRTISECRACGGVLVPILSLGEHYVTNFVISDEESKAKVPLELVLCDPDSGGCGLLQLKHTTSPELLYAKHYWYRSGVNQTMQGELADIARKAGRVTQLAPGEVVLDIGCNDGTLLRSYTVPDLKLIGIDPAANLAEFAREGATQIISDFFTHDVWRRARGSEQAKVITAIAMFYDLDNPNAFVRDVQRTLAPSGVFVIQQNYLALMLELNAFDNILHEHLEYFSLLSLERLLTRHDLEVFDVELRDVNGGSFRTYVRHTGAAQPASDGGAGRVGALREKESHLKLSSRKTYDTFAQRAEKIRDALSGFVRRAVGSGETVYVYGASTRGNTTLQFCGLDHTLIRGAAERNPDKWGKKTVGTLIPIVSEEEARRAKPDYFLVLPWYFLNEFREREKAFLEGGGKFIVPFPEPRIISAKGEEPL